MRRKAKSPTKPARYDFAKAEKKWRGAWKREGVYEPSFLKAKNPFYNLMMFPYPSAEGLHIGAVRTYSGVDIYGRRKRMQGFDVFEPIGLDGFGIHSENFALKVGRHPVEHAKISEKNFYRQLDSIGNGFAWKERLETYDPEYYRWTQWIFARLFKAGLAYRKKQAVNWCPTCKTVLADEQVEGGACERCGSAAEKRDLEQWFFRITRYAEELLQNLDRLDWTEKIKLAQKNWIGKSEGAEIDFPLGSGLEGEAIKVFTTRPDTLFGATYLVLAPEHPFVTAALEKGLVKNANLVRIYVATAKARSEEERIAETKDKKGVEMKGLKAINPATKEEIPIWIADYVLGGYGTGAIMAVPAHDERDHEFAKKYDLPMVQVLAPLFPLAGAEAPQEGKPLLKRNVVSAIIRDPATGKYLLLKRSEFGRIGFPGGGIDEAESSENAVAREIQEETGYQNFSVKKIFPLFYGHGYDRKREKNCWGLEAFYAAELENADRQALHSEDEGVFEQLWVTEEEVEELLTLNHHREVWNYYRNDIKLYAGEGILINSGEFDGLESEEAKWKITEMAGGKRKIQYRLRDWLISRQRYWGPPIPMIFCETCAESGKGEQEEMPGWYAVPEKDLPVKLPMVKEFQPRGTGESPLATVKSFYEAKCPACKSKARRETDVSDTFLDSAWYYLRYPSVKEKKHAWNPGITKKWFPVDMYIGGPEHSVLHLLYVRFLSLAFRDMGLLNAAKKSAAPVGEPFPTFRAHGLITKDGAKMSKSKGNVVNPDEYLKKYGADVMRMYLAFLAPLTQGGDFRDEGIVGITRFLERAWRAVASETSSKKESDDVQRILNRTIKKVGDDIEELQYNTAISALMICLNELEKTGPLSRGAKETFAKLLAPFAPFMAEELWRTVLGRKKSIHREAWPAYDEKRIAAETITLVIQVNGKTRATVEASASISETEARELALNDPKVAGLLEGRSPRRVIYIPGRLINIVV